MPEATETQTGSEKDSQEILNDSKLEDNTIGTVKNLPYATVHATAVFKNCPHAQLTQDDIDSLGRFITCTDHLKKNVPHPLPNSNRCGCFGCTHTS